MFLIEEPCHISYKSTGGNKDPRFITPNSKKTLREGNQVVYEMCCSLNYLKNTRKHNLLNCVTQLMIVRTFILAEVANSKGVYYNMDCRFYDQNTLEELDSNSIYGKYQNADFAGKVIRMNYDIHIGSIRRDHSLFC